MQSFAYLGSATMLEELQGKGLQSGSGGTREDVNLGCKRPNPAISNGCYLLHKAE